MNGMSVFESRTGRLSCSAAEAYRFISDIRNFERFIPSDRINNWKADRDSCSFSVPLAGAVNVNISRKEEHSLVVYSGTAMSDTDFAVKVSIGDNAGGRAEVKIIAEAALNPVLKMVASGPAKQFLEKLVEEMEKFDDWSSVRE